MGMVMGTRSIARPIAIAVLLFVITVIHFTLGSGAAGLMHSILGHLYLVPIIMAAYWHGLAGGVAVSIASALLFSPHLFMHWHDPFLDIFNYVEIFLYLLIGGTTGVLSQMERNQRRQYEQALVRLDESHRKLKEQTEILFQTEEQLRRADRLSALGELSAGMAHEIRNPLGSIKGAAEILRDDYLPEDPKFEFLQILLRETDRLNAIVQEFLGFARPKPPEYREADVNGIIESVAALTVQQAKKAGVVVALHPDRSIGIRNLDGGLLQQAVLNLVLNAIQAMNGGGTLDIATGCRDGILSISVADSGPGITPENKKKLFTPFFTTKNNGTGLGLAITYRIVQNHKGTIDVESEPAKGAVFTIRIPV
ncbi:MAG: ATP-binding protein [Nitrospiraceae bacterium]|nr:ATP-binding protein [Nitrospiraceae bacterium]